MVKAAAIFFLIQKGFLTLAESYKQLQKKLSKSQYLTKNIKSSVNA